MGCVGIEKARRNVVLVTCAGVDVCAANDLHGSCM